LVGRFNECNKQGQKEWEEGREYTEKKWGIPGCQLATDGGNNDNTIGICNIDVLCGMQPKFVAAVNVGLLSLG